MPCSWWTTGSRCSIGTNTLFVGIPWKGKELVASAVVTISNATDETLDEALKQMVLEIAKDPNNWIYRNALAMRADEQPSVRAALLRLLKQFPPPKSKYPVGTLEYERDIEMRDPAGIIQQALKRP